jgi:hypothetical protein
MAKQIRKIGDLIPDVANANRGTERGDQALQQSLQQYGAGRSILIDKNGNVIAGNKTLEKAGQAGIENIEIVRTDGNTLVAVQRTDLDLHKDKEARELAYADNRVGQLSLDWNPEQLLQDVEAELEIPFFYGYELADLLSTDEEITDLPDGDGSAEHYHKIIVHFDSPDDLEDFAATIGQPVDKNINGITYARQPKDD